MRWCVISGRNVGLHVWAQVFPSFFLYIIYHVVLLGVRSTETAFLSWPRGVIGPSTCFRCRSMNICMLKPPSLQGFKLMTAAEIHKQANKCFNLCNTPCVSQLMCHSRSKEDTARLCQVGNMVLPKCANLAMHVLAAAHLEDDA